MTTQTDFLAAVNQIAAERGINAEDVFLAIEEAMLAAYKKYYGEGESLYTELNRQTGEIRMIADKKVVERITDDKTQISLEMAQNIEPRLKKGDHVEVDVTPEEGFGRLAAQVAKQVILQKVREAEKNILVSKFQEKVGTIQAGIIQRMQGPVVIVEIDKIVVQMPQEEQMFGEYYKAGDRKKFYLKEVQQRATDSQLVVSRACPEFLSELFALEVPEIATGTVEIKSVAREAGSRSKVAVHSNQDGVDPIGSCVGQRGVRINAVTDELSGEKIDIILWDEEPEAFIANALSPAEVLEVKLDEENKTALIKVPEDQLSLAIGKEGQNVRLAAKLTGWKIDISGPEGKVIGSAAIEEEEKGEESDEKMTEETEESSDSVESLGLGTKVNKALDAAGYTTVEQVKALGEEELLEIKGLGKKTVEKILDAVK